MNKLNKKCKDCSEIKCKESDFYKAGASYQARCKPCHNNFRKRFPNIKKEYIKKPRGFEAQTADTQIIICRMINEHEKFKDIAVQTNVKYATLLQWHRKGQIHQTP